MGLSPLHDGASARPLARLTGMEEVSVQWWGDRPGDNAPPAGWLRVAWNFCWEYGLRRPFPHPPAVLDDLRRVLRAYLTEREAPAYKLEALVDWSAGEYVWRRAFEESRPSVGAAERTGRPPLRPRPYLLIPELPPLMRLPDVGGRFRPLVQLAKDWAVRPACRGRMMADPPPPDTEPALAASIAAVVHALCDLDEISPPAWVFDHRIPLQDESGACGKSTGPPITATRFCAPPPPPAPTTTFSSHIP